MVFRSVLLNSVWLTNVDAITISGLLSFGCPCCMYTTVAVFGKKKCVDLCDKVHINCASNAIQ